MNIGLIDIEPKIHNTALMQIAYHHKTKGDNVEWVMPLNYDTFDILYCSSIFNFTSKSQLPKRTLCGGTGFDLTTTLTFDCDYDYSIYPTCDCSYVWFSRGCIRNCPYCVVRQKEGWISVVKPKPLNPRGRYIKIQDNNFFASPGWRGAIRWLQKTEQKVDFNGGVDARRLNKEQCDALNSLKHEKQIKIAWDNPKENLIPKLQEIIKYIKSYRLMCYVLIGYWSTPKEDLYRVSSLRELGIDPFVMPYDKRDSYQRDFARWVNHKAIFKSIKWKDYVAANEPERKDNRCENTKRS